MSFLSFSPGVFGKEINVRRERPAKENVRGVSWTEILTNRVAQAVVK
jgi:hypothetical protein